jgi:hypothetical protein
MPRWPQHAHLAQTRAGALASPPLLIPAPRPAVGRARSASDTGAQAPNQASGELTGRGSLDVQAPMHRELPPTYLVRLGRQASPR